MNIHVKRYILENWNGAKDQREASPTDLLAMVVAQANQAEELAKDLTEARAEARAEVAKYPITEALYNAMVEKLNAIEKGTGYRDLEVLYAKAIRKLEQWESCYDYVRDVMDL